MRAEPGWSWTNERGELCLPRDHGAVVWLDVHYRLTEGDLTGWVERAREGGGVLAWLEHDHLVSPLQPGSVRHSADTRDLTQLWLSTPKD